VSVDLAKCLWVQDDNTNETRRRAYVETPDFYGLSAVVPFGIDGAYRKYLDPDEALSMAKALVGSVQLALQQSMEPTVRQKLEGLLDEVVVVTQNALRWRTTPRKVGDTE
jgi:hypothetical protein